MTSQVTLLWYVLSALYMTNSDEHGHIMINDHLLMYGFCCAITVTWRPSILGDLFCHCHQSAYSSKWKQLTSVVMLRHCVHVTFYDKDNSSSVVHCLLELLCFPIIVKMF